jgi:hypothetical protein
MTAKERSITLADGSTVSALWQKPKDAKAVLVLAHGAGAGDDAQAHGRNGRRA